MTDDKTPEPQKIPPKLKVRPAASKGEPEDQAKGQPPEQASVPPPKPAAAADKNDTDKPQPPAGIGDEPTVILKKPGADTDDPKKKTSRISLDSALSMRISDAMGELEADDQIKGKGPKTIRLSRPPAAGAPSTPPASAAAADSSGPKTIRLKRPGAAAAPSSPPPTSKKQTSRISLDNVLPSSAKEGDAAAKEGQTEVKTIRLKRPDMPKPAATAPKPPQGGSAEEQEAKSRTARLDQADTQEPAPDAVPSTQRKTIRIKRPDGSGATKPGRTLSLAREKAAPAQDPETDAKTEIPDEPMQPQGPGLVFTLIAVAAAIVAALVVYMLAAQAFPDAGLSWWGQINP